jgi:hypothetical protein
VPTFGEGIFGAGVFGEGDSGEVVVTLGLPVDTDTALPLTVIAPVLRVLGVATETDTASPLAVVESQVVPLGVAVETDVPLRLRENVSLQDTYDAAPYVTLIANEWSTLSAPIDGYGTESGEPSFEDGGSPNQSGWVVLVPDEDGSLRIVVTPDSVVEVFQPGDDGATLGALVRLAAGQGEVRDVPVMAGDPVWVRVSDPASGDSVTVDVTEEPEPGRSRADAIVIDGREGSITFTTDVLEDDPTLEAGVDEATWLVWEGVEPGTLMRFTTKGGLTDPDATIHVETDVETLVDGDEDVRFLTAEEEGPEGPQATDHYVLVGTRSPERVVTLTWTDVSDLDGDEPETAVEIDGDYGAEDVEMEGLTVADDETVDPGVAATGWLLWEAPADSPMQVFAEGDEETLTTLTVFTGPEGSTLDDLTEVEPETGDLGGAFLTFTAAAGDLYWIRVGTGNDLSGAVSVTWMGPDEEVAEPSEPAPYIRVEVYDRTGDTLLSEVPRRWGLSGSEPLNTTGTGELSVRLDDAGGQRRVGGVHPEGVRPDGAAVAGRLHGEARPAAAPAAGAGHEDVRLDVDARRLVQAVRLERADRVAAVQQPARHRGEEERAAWLARQDRAVAVRPPGGDGPAPARPRDEVLPAADLGEEGGPARPHVRQRR